MTKIALADVPAGSVLASPVLDTKGRILLKDGSVLSPKLVKKLQKWGVHEVQIVGGPEETDESTPKAAPVLTGTPWSEMFAPYAGQPEMDLIHCALRTWKASRSVDAQ